MQHKHVNKHKFFIAYMLFTKLQDFFYKPSKGLLIFSILSLGQ